MAQSKISVEVEANGEEIRRLMREASDSAAQLIHFPEGILSGYVKSQIKSWNDVEWNRLHNEVEQIKGLARDLNLWSVFDSNQWSEIITRNSVVQHVYGW